jgi:hypothetical protein
MSAFAVRDGADIERFLKTFHLRCWLAGLGWMMVGAGGQLERSIVDRMVGAPERLVFEGGPVIEPPLQQDRDSRRPIAIEGDTLDTVVACPPLSIVELSQLNTLRAKWSSRLADEAGKTRRAFIASQAQALAARKGLALAEAEKVYRPAMRGHPAARSRAAIRRARAWRLDGRRCDCRPGTVRWCHARRSG